MTELYAAAFRHALDRGLRPEHAEKVADYALRKARAAEAYYLQRNNSRGAK